MIDSFSGEHAFLSNFYSHPLIFDGRLWPTAEHAFQGAKARTDVDALFVLAAATPGQAKRRGRQIEIRPEWNAVRLEVMLAILRAKFADPVLRGQLLATGDAELVEGNTWGDTFWGVCRGKGENHLGRLLMQVRAEAQTL